jgi:molybdopterin synthase catalytic subunit
MKLSTENFGLIDITYAPINLESVLAAVTRPVCGAQVLFVGTTRQWTGDIETLFLEYECYLEMAKKMLEQLEAEARSRWPIAEVVIVHRLGQVEICQASIAVAVGAPHRDAAFAAARWLIDEVKVQVPIWKREHTQCEPGGTETLPSEHGKSESARWVHPS